MSADSSRPPSLMMPSEEPELELDDLKPLRAPDRERDLRSQEDQALAGGAALGFEPASIPSAAPQAMSPEPEPELAPELELEGASESMAWPEGEEEQSQASQLKPPRARRVAPPRDEPFEAPQAPLFPPRGGMGAPR